MKKLTWRLHCKQLATRLLQGDSTNHGLTCTAVFFFPVLKVTRKEMTATNFYFSRLFEACPFFRRKW